jgi:DNA helicase-2/ATP-dependent DNA helicase PcrA
MNKDFSMIYEGLNPAQKQAVEQYEGPSLIVAGAGSGKTKVLTCRIANILSHGYSASSILALTFTNKASREMKNRIAGLVGWDRARNLWMGTFHSVFVRFLREDADLLGFPRSFTIYDTSDSRSAVRNCIKELQLDEKQYKPNEVLARISIAKNNLVTAAAYSVNNTLQQMDIASRKPRIADIYTLYEKRCRQSGAMDFDDILLYTNILIRDNPSVLEKLQKRFSFVLVDEYQDTNYAQYLIVKKLAQFHGNICVVGDDSQSIYAFRGARIENILNFRKDYPQVKEFRLEQNYRSTQTIVKAANSLIAKNSLQLKKECFSSGSMGEKIEVVSAWTDQEEAFLLASSILSRIYSEKASYGDFVVLYRTNAQSRAVEEALRKRSVPYKIFGGHSFYERAEVKDMISYLRLLTNKKDDEAFRRVVNVPPRGLGNTTMTRLSAAANSEGVSMWEAVLKGDLSVMGISASIASKLLAFIGLVEELSSKIASSNAYDIALETLVRTGYMEHLKSDSSVEGRARLDNVEELLNSIKAFVEEFTAQEDDKERESQDSGTEDLSSGISADNRIMLPNYLENIALLSAQDENNAPEDSNKISLMTVHTAKGLEFPYVYVIGMEENLFPSGSMMGIPESELEEERRLFYVAITRAKYNVTLSYAQSRFRWGSHVNYPASRFLKEIDPKFLDWPALESEGLHARAGGNWSRISSVPDGAGGKSHQGFLKHNNGHSSNVINQSPGRTIPAPAPDFKPDPVSMLKEGQRIEHDRFGYGTIVLMEGEYPSTKATVDFEDWGRKILLIKFAKLRIIR